MKLRRVHFAWVLVLASTSLLLASQGTPAPKSPEPQDRESYFRSIVVERGNTLGNVVCIFCSVTVLGTVKGDVAAIWGSAVVEGVVEGDVAAVGGSIRATAGSRIDGDAAAVGGRVV